WFFRGWIPYSPGDPEAGSADHHHEVAMTVDGDGLPARWTDHTGENHTVDRVLVHWQSTAEAIDSPDVWQVAATAPHVSGRSAASPRSEEHTSELQSRFDLVCRLLLETKKKNIK